MSTFGPISCTKHLPGSDRVLDDPEMTGSVTRLKKDKRVSEEEIERTEVRRKRGRTRHLHRYQDSTLVDTETFLGGAIGVGGRGQWHGLYKWSRPSRSRTGTGDVGRRPLPEYTTTRLTRDTKVVLLSPSDSWLSVHYGPWPAHPF